MRKWFGVLIFFFSLSAHAQTTTVSAIVVDSDGTAWANGSWTVNFVPNPNNPNINQYNINGVPLTQSQITQTGAMNGTGVLSVSVLQSTVISPSGSAWVIQVCPTASSPCGTYQFQTSTSTLNISTPLTSSILAPRFKASMGNYGYADVEAQIQLIPGNIYYQTTSSCFRFYNGTSWSCLGTGGTIPSMVAFSPVGTAGTQGGTTNQIQAIAGPLNIPTLTNNNALNTPIDNGTLITNALSGGANIVLPNNTSLQGNAIKYASTILEPIGGSTLQGTGTAEPAPAPFGTTELIYTLTTGDGIDSFCPTLGCDGVNMGNFTLEAATASSGSGIKLACVTGTTDCANGTHIYDVLVQGFQTALNIVGNGNLVVERGYFTGNGPATSAPTTGYVIDSTVAGGTNSIRFHDIKGGCGLQADSPSIVVPCTGFLRIGSGNGVQITAGDVDGYNIGMEMGNSTVPSYVNGFTIDMQHCEVGRGPDYLIDTGGQGTAILDCNNGGLYLGAPVADGISTYVNLIANDTPTDTFGALASTTISTTGGSLSGTKYFWIQANDPVAPIFGSASTYSAWLGVQATGAQVLTGSTNTVTLSWYYLAGSASTTFYIYENTTNNSATAELIATSTANTQASGIAGSYTVTGSETPVATFPTAPNIPMATKGNYQAQIDKVGVGSFPNTSFPHSNNMIMDSTGTEYYPIGGAWEFPISFAPTAGTSASGIFNGALVQVMNPPGTTNGSGALLYCNQTYVSSVLGCTWQNLLVANLPITASFTDSTSLTQLYIEQSGVGTANPLVSLVANNANTIVTPLFLASQDTSGTRQILTMQESFNSANTTFGFGTSKFTIPYNQVIYTPVAAVSGTNQSSPILQIYGSAWNGSADQQTGWTWQNVINNTATTPTETLTLGTQSGAGLTPIWDIDFSAATGGMKVASLTVATSRKGTFVCTSGGTISISNTNELVTSDVIISLNTAGGTISTPPAMKTTTTGTGFSVLCATSDTSTYNYDILN